jgi:predicted Holliday junction resolvase-like endonuclease
MSYELVALIAGVFAGALAVYAVLSRRIISRAHLIATQLFEVQRSHLDHAVRQEYEAKLAEWKGIELASTIQSERKDAVERARAILKGRIGEQIAPMLPEFLSNFNPADARFIGSQID